MALNLDKIKERLEKLNTPKNQNKDFTSIFWKIPNGESTVRLVPLPDGDAFKEHFQHYSVGKSAPFLCPRKERGEECPVCEFVNKLYKSQNPDDIALAKKIGVKSRYFAPVLVRGEEDKKIRFWSFSKTVYAKLVKILNKTEEYGDITDPLHGTDLALDCHIPDGGIYPLTDVEVKRKESKLCKDISDEDCNKLLETIPDLESALGKKSSEEIKKILDAWILAEGEEGADVNEDVEKFGSHKEAKSEENDIDKAFNELMG